MNNIYKIQNTTYLDPEKDYFNPDLYPNFQEDYFKFKDVLIQDSQLEKNSTYYKFGDGDYLLFKNQKHGTTKPGVRDIKKSFRPLDIEKVKKYAHMHDKYFCEIINFDLMNEVLNKNIDFPAEDLNEVLLTNGFFQALKKLQLLDLRQN